MWWLKYFLGYATCRFILTSPEKPKITQENFEIVFVTAKRESDGSKLFYIKDEVFFFKPDIDDKTIQEYLKEKLSIYNKFIIVGHPETDIVLMEDIENILKTLGKKYWSRVAGERETLWLKKQKAIK